MSDCNENGNVLRGQGGPEKEFTLKSLLKSPVVWPPMAENRAWGLCGAVSEVTKGPS